jgi:hypothetical protein
MGTPVPVDGNRIPADWEMPSHIRSTLSARLGHQRSIEVQGHKLVLLHWVPKLGQAQRIGVFLWRRPDGEWFSYSQAVPGSETDPDPDFFVLREALQAYEDREDLLETELDQVEEARAYLRVRGEITTVQHAMANLFTTLDRAAGDGAEVLAPLRDHAYELHRKYELLETFSRHRLETFRAVQAEQANRRADDLNRIVAFTLPLTAFSSVFAMNPNRGESLTDPVFWGVTALGLIWGSWLWYRVR